MRSCEFSRYDVPAALLLDVVDTMGRYGRLVLGQNPSGDGLILTTSDAAVLAEVRRAKAIIPLLGDSLAPDMIAVSPANRGRLKQALIKVGWPADDQAGYVDGTGFELSLLESDDFSVRAYQQAAAERVLGGRKRRHRPALRRGQDHRRHGGDGAGQGDDADPRHDDAVGSPVAQRAAGPHHAHGGRHRGVLGRSQGDPPGHDRHLPGARFADEGRVPPPRVFDAQDWGLIIYDEVHLLPAPVFRATADIQSRRRLGLTATLIREDGREADVFSLIGPKRFDVAVEGHRRPRAGSRPPRASRCASR